MSEPPYPVRPPPARRTTAMVGRAEVLVHRPDLAAVWQAADDAFAVRVTRTFWERIHPGDPADPLALQVLPDPRELVPDPGDLADPVGDAACSPVPWVVHKYPDRVLLLLTKRCHLYCRYCFRRTHDPGDAPDPTPEEWAAALEYVRGCGAREVILSGGDPLCVPDHRLFDTIDALRPALRVVRVHTRAPITYPRRVTAALVSGLRDRAPVFVVVHANHPRELAPDVDDALARLVDGGVPVLNQSVLLRGVNDSPDVLAALCEALVERRIVPYYLHHTDRVAGNAHLRVSLDDGRRIVAALRERLGGIAAPTYVLDPPDGSGKVPVDLH